MEKKSDNGKKPIIIISVLLVLVLVIILILVAFLFLGRTPVEAVPEEPEVSTEEPLANYDYNMEQEEMFLKYGNFKNHETALNVIESSLSGEDESVIQKEVFNYWFTLIRYGDYSDAYTFVDVEQISRYGINYSYEQFMMDCEDLCVRGGVDDDLWLHAEIIDGSTPSTADSIGNLHMAVITSDAEADTGVALFMPFYITENRKIIPFDILQQSVSERYSVVSGDSGTEPISEPDSSEELDNNENTGMGGSTEDSSSETASDTGASDSTSRGDME